MRKLTVEEDKAKETIMHAISDYRTELEAITLVKDDVDMDPVMIGGSTRTGFYCHLMVDPRTIAPILLKYDYPILAILDEECPQAMWDELAHTFGLASVDEFDL